MALDWESLTAVIGFNYPDPAATAPLSVVTKKWCYIKENDDDEHFEGTTASVGSSTTGSGSRERIVFTIKLPEAPENAGKITEIKLRIKVQGFTGSASHDLRLWKCDADYIAGEAGETDPSVGEGFGATWRRFNGWESGPDHVDNNWAGTGTVAVVAIAPNVDSGDVGTWVYWDLRALIPALAWGGEYSFTMISDKETSSVQDEIDFYTPQAAVANRPGIEVTYIIEKEREESTEPEQESILNIEPDETNPIYSKLSWKKPKDVSVRTDDSGAYCIIRDTSPIEDYTDGTLIARITSATEYVDTATLTDNQEYYYRILVCDENNYVVTPPVTGAMTGMIVVGSPKFTNEVVMERPSVFAFAETGDDYSWDVWEEHTVQVTPDTPILPGITIEAYQIDWFADGSETGWVQWTKDGVLNNTVDYRYTTSNGGSVTPRVRVKNTLGFVSDWFNLASAIILSPINAEASIRAAPYQVEVGTGFRLRGDESIDPNGDGAITKYEFQIKRTSDNYYWNGAAWQVGVFWIDQTTTPYYDVPDAAITVATYYECKCKVTGLSGTPNNSGAIEILAVSIESINFRDGLVHVTEKETGTENPPGPPAPFRLEDIVATFVTNKVVPGDWVHNETENLLAMVITVISETALELDTDIMNVGDVYTVGRRVDDSRVRSVETNIEAIITKTTPLEGDADVRIEEGVRSKVKRFDGVSHKKYYLTDVLRLQIWIREQTRLKYYFDEPVLPASRYVIFKITSLQENRRLEHRVEWTINVDVIAEGED